MITKLTKWRRQLHQIPELGLEEVKTTLYLFETLKQMGYVPEPLPGLTTGCYVFIDHHCQQTIAFRSDIDGLPIEEENDISFASHHKGFMHACGHDGHMAMLLGLAEALKTKTVLHNNILLLFQPAEESPGAAKIIAASDLFERFKVKAVYGLHLMPMIDEGLLCSKPGPLMAECGELNVIIHGQSTHAGTPHQGIDSILIASDLIQRYQAITSRRLSPYDAAVIHIGTIHGGDVRNSMANQVTMTGTVRCYSDQVFRDIVSMMTQINQGLEMTYGCRIELDLEPMYPPLINDDRLYQKTCQATDLTLLKEPLMLAEDFAFYGQVVPSLFTFLGTKGQYTSGLHTGSFNFDESVLIHGVRYYLSIIESEET